MPLISMLESSVTLPANMSPPTSPIAGSVLPIRRAEELLATLPGVISAKIVAGETGAVNEIHILTTTEVPPKQTVRNIESALIAHLGMRVDHRKISVATTEAPRARVSGGMAAIPEEPAAPPPPAVDPFGGKRSVYFEDVEVRRSRAKGVLCRVTLRKGEELFVGEAEGVENDRSRMELAARATVFALMKSDKEGRTLAVDGAKLVDAFDREFVFVGITARIGRETSLLTGSCQIRDSVETASALAVLDATNRWIESGK